ncbi:ATP-binding domain-containing protein [Neptuniibacter sp. CAU 1671]|uniref:DEAD/DEAH box helicase n=1 Tax=Neptuniibacter sp. CAU 1671 TaxID=3032593 RepID=UPI0023DAF053|nr:ATP-binding domain-containing protein [Neptuniibacter sp. CAU 1671]MDF2180598.1 ATP-binding domain-containing protein [Neptuniibacter sp. CAU 1671]
MSMQFLPGSLEIDNDPYDLELWEHLSNLLAKQEGYCAYKIPVLGTTSLSEVPTFVVVTKESGIFLIDICHEKVVGFEEDGRVWRTVDSVTYSRDIVLELYKDEIESRLKRSPNLYSRKYKNQKVPVNCLIIFRDNSPDELEKINYNDYVYSETTTRESYSKDLAKFFTDNHAWDGTDQQFDDILSLIEGTWGYRDLSETYDKAKQPSTINDFIQLSLQRTFKQDEAQRQVSMQIPNGPQRIRGLAGTGKTVVLSLKAALTALRFKDFKILYLFNTQSLYHTIGKQIGDYYAKESKSSLPSGVIDILHAWGGKTSGEGLYSKTCADYGITPLTLRDVRGSNDALSAIYKDLDNKIGDNITPIYDMVLIDEAQDFPNEVFEVVYKLTKNPKRIVVAYDDFQSLKSIKIREFYELFGTHKDGTPRFSQDALEGQYVGGIDKDFVLPNCYRNPRNILMIAHGIALGIARKGGVVDSVDRASDWKALGYQINSPKSKSTFSAGDEIEVERLSKNSTNLLENLLTEQSKLPNKLIQIEKFNTREEEADYISNKVYDLIENQDVKAHDIFVIAIDTKNSENFLKDIRSKLNSVGIKSIMPGFVESSRHFFEQDCVVLTTPFKAKGNEANIVFVGNCEQVVQDTTFRKRNSFFVSVTRSRGWCYVSGIQDAMNTLLAEINKIQSELPKFKYIRPSDNQIARRRLILSKSDSGSELALENLNKLVEENPELLIEHLEQLKFNITRES